MINLKVLSGLIQAVLGFFAMCAVVLLSSPSVTIGALMTGIIGFFIMFSYGLEKAIAAYFKAEHDSRINN